MNRISVNKNFVCQKSLWHWFTFIPLAATISIAMLFALVGCDQTKKVVVLENQQTGPVNDELTLVTDEVPTTSNSEQEGDPPPFPLEEDDQTFHQETTRVPATSDSSVAEEDKEKGMLGQAANLFEQAKSKGAAAASGTGKWVQDQLGAARDSGEQTIEDTVQWATDSFNSLKDQGLTTAKDTSEWLSEDWKNMDRWEYKIMTLGELDDVAAAEKLNELGREGWECFHIAGERCFFKKPSSSYLRSLPFKDVIKLVPLMNAGSNDK